MQTPSNRKIFQTFSLNEIHIMILLHPVLSAHKQFNNCMQFQENVCDANEMEDKDFSDNQVVVVLSMAMWQVQLHLTTKNLINNVAQLNALIMVRHNNHFCSSQTNFLCSILVLISLTDVSVYRKWLLHCRRFVLFSNFSIV